MNPAIFGILTAAAAYLAGSIPFGYLIPALVMRDDIRRHGSGNPGATNVARVMGPRWGLLVLLLDVLKGALPVRFLPPLAAEFGLPPAQHIPVLCAVAVILGHTFPVWLAFRGGKGVATALGAVLVLATQASLLAFAAFAVTFVPTRIVSLSSLVAAATFCVAQLVQAGASAWDAQHLPLTTFSVVIPALIVWRHRANIQRLLSGTEPRMQFRRPPGSQETTRTPTKQN